jgi:hypothetical protein
LTPDPEEPLEKVAGLLCRNRNGARNRDGGAPSHFSLRVCFRFDVRRGICTRHLRICILRIVRIFFVAARNVPSGVIHILNHLERVRLVRRREPGHLHVEVTLIHSQRAFQNSRRDWPGDAATVLATLYHGHDYVFGIFEGGKTGKPGNRIFMASIRRLGRSGFSGNLHIFQTRSSARPAIFINNFPKAFAHEIDLLA